VVHIAALALLLAAQQPPEPPPDKALADKLLERLFRCMNEGRFSEGRAVAEHIVDKFRGTPAAMKARPYAADNAFLSMEPVEITGPTANRIDFVIMGDGVPYEDGPQRSWQREAEAVLKALFKTPTLKEYAPYFNLYRAHLASKEARISRPPDSPAVTFFRSFEEDGELRTAWPAAQGVADLLGGSDRLALVHVRASGAEHARSGSGVAVVGFTHPPTAMILHAFGHAFAGLADEAASRKSWGGLERKIKDPPPPPVAPNVSGTKDPAAVPWAHWLKAKAEGDRRAAKIGVHEGAALLPQKAWRPVDESLCVMNDGSDFCPVCREAVVLVLYTYIRPIEEALPCDRLLVAEPGGAAKVWVRTLRPATHKLTVGWFVEKAVEGEKSGLDAQGRMGDLTPLRCDDGKPGGRRGEGAAWRMPQGTPFSSDPSPDPANPRDTLTLDRTKLEPGRYRVTAVVRDSTEWVLRDTQNLLVDWRRWIVEVK
jgi:hypothetical protein